MISSTFKFMKELGLIWFKWHYVKSIQFSTDDDDELIVLTAIVILKRKSRRCWIWVGIWLYWPREDNLLIWIQIREKFCSMDWPSFLGLGQIMFFYPFLLYLWMQTNIFYQKSNSQNRDLANFVQMSLFQIISILPNLLEWISWLRLILSPILFPQNLFIDVAQNS